MKFVKATLAATAPGAVLLAPSSADAGSYWDKFMSLFRDEPVAQVVETLDIDAYRDAFNQETTLQEKTYFKEMPVSFEFRRPTAWEDMNLNSDNSVNIDSRLLKAFDMYRGPVIVGGTRPNLQIQSIELQHEILAEHWLQDYIFKNGYTQTAEVKSNSETDASVDFVFLDGPVSSHGYMKVFIIGKRLLALRYNVPDIAEDKLKAFGPLIVDSFTVTGFTSEVIEESADFSLQNQLNFSYPTSWTVQNKMMTNPYEKSLELQNIKDEEIKGLIRVIAYNKNGAQSVQEIVNGFSRLMKDTHGMRVTELQGSVPLNISIGYDAAVTELYQAGATNTQYNNYQIWVTALESPNWLNFIYLITPNKDIDYYNWARNTRAYDMIIHSIN